MEAKSVEFTLTERWKFHHDVEVVLERVRRKDLQHFTNGTQFFRKPQKIVA